MPNVPPTNLIMEQSAHCDWDWQTTNAIYYDQGFTTWGQPAVRSILNDGVANVQKYLGNNPPYIYTFCEMAYLRLYVQEDQSRIATLQALKGNFTVSSGGFTSAENLINHGEAFIRNYLLGRYWLQQTIGLPVSNRMWIPDDFGHDAQLPIVLVAMGFTGVGFERIAGWDMTLTSTAESPFSILNDKGRDFQWRAADGSTIQAHWLSNGYGEGNSDITNDPADPIQQMITENANSPTPWLFVPIDNDFSLPYPNPGDSTDLMTIISSWNTGNPGGVQAQLSTFDEFLTQVANSGYTLATVSPNPTDGSLPYVPHPYWSGCYATRPGLKQAHYAATRLQLFNESIELLLEYLASIDSKWSLAAQSNRESIATAWDTLMPSTHHDYITGTAVQAVYDKEQISGSWSVTEALTQAQNAQTGLLTALANALPNRASIGPITVGCFNNLGFNRNNALVTIPAPASSSPVLSSTMDGTTYTAVQYSDDKSQLMLFASVQPLGYGTSVLSLTTASGTPPTLTLVSNGNDTYTIANEYLSATVGGYGISALYDLLADPGKNVLNGSGNELVWYEDDGNIYRFGNEMWNNNNVPNPKFAPTPDPPAYQNIAVSVTADGPIVKQITATFSIVDPNNSQNTQTFTQTYTLVGSENILRIQTTGAAPSGQTNQSQGYTVMAAFPFNTTPASLTFGTPYHWDTRAPRNYYENWPLSAAEQITFEPTHEFLIANDSSMNAIFAIYQFSTVAWGIDPNGTLLGCILRNAPGSGNGASGYDEATHTVSYAIRLPGNNLQSPTTGCAGSGPLGEALSFNNPIVGTIATSFTTGELPDSMSIASTTDATALISAAKVATANSSSWILRVYQPTNGSYNLQIDLDSNIAKMFNTGGTVNVAAVSAMEAPIPQGEFNLVPSASSFSFTAPRALATFSLTSG